MKGEPVLTILTGLVAASIALLIAFGVNVSTEQAEAIGGFVVALYGAAAWIRSRVRPVRKS